MRASRVGTAALLVECADAAAAQSWWAEAVRRREAGELVCDDLVPGARTVLLDGVPDAATLADEITGWELRDGPEEQQRAAVELPVTWDGPDLEEVSRLTGLGVDEVVRGVREAAYVVAFCGFAPGFAYLAGLPDELHVPRRDDPRTRVPPGSVGLAGEFTGVYPGASPGGWQLVARTERTLWDSGADPPALLLPGTPVRFVDA